ncbi:MAG: alpha/beta fold hydrolase, partial [Gammaproteobacteria bacterium]|nr:alpha/beta fold hydrolase [Gammaproteobacteria bacterium]
EADKQAYVNAWSQPGALEAMLNYYRALNLDMNEDKTPDWSSFALAPEMKRFLQKIQGPTLVIWGEQDEALVPENLVGLDQFVENLQVKKLAECGHFLVHEHSNQINQLIDAFLVK